MPAVTVPPFLNIGFRFSKLFKEVFNINVPSFFSNRGYSSLSNNIFVLFFPLEIFTGMISSINRSEFKA